MGSASEIPPWMLVSQRNRLMSYDMFSSRFRSIKNPLTAWNCIGSSKGWLLFTIESREYVTVKKNNDEPNKNKPEPNNSNFKITQFKLECGNFKLVVEPDKNEHEPDKNEDKPNKKKRRRNRKKKKSIEEKKKPIEEKKLVVHNKFVLFNPVSSTEVQLPRMDVLRDVPTSFRLSSPPDSPSCLIAVTFTVNQDQSRLLICRPEDETWTVVFQDFFKDILFQNGVLHALVRRGHSDDKPNTHIFRIGDRDHNLNFIKQDPESEPLVPYLVGNNDGGELLIVQRKFGTVIQNLTSPLPWWARFFNRLVKYGKDLLVSVLIGSLISLVLPKSWLNTVMTWSLLTYCPFEQDYDADEVEVYHQTSNEFQVFKIDDGVMKRLHRLDDKVLFLSHRSGSVSIKVSEFNMLKANRIFFDHSDAGGEFGVFSLEDDKIERYFPTTGSSTMFLFRD